MEILNRLLPAQVWNAKKGEGSFITFDMGKLVEIKRKNSKVPKGAQLHLWIYMCDWVLLKNGNVILTSDEISENNKSKLDIFSAINFNTLIVNENMKEVNLYFDNDIQLLLKNNESYSVSDEYFMLFIEGEGVYVFSADKGLVFKKE